MDEASDEGSEFSRGGELLEILGGEAGQDFGYIVKGCHGITNDGQGFVCREWGLF